MIRLIEKNLGKKARIEFRPFQKVDMKATQADIGEARKILHWTPKISLDEGIRLAVAWYLANRVWLSKVRI